MLKRHLNGSTDVCYQTDRMFSSFVDIEWKQKQKDDTCLNIERIIRWEKQLRRVM